MAGFCRLRLLQAFCANMLPFLIVMMITVKNIRKPLIIFCKHSAMLMRRLTIARGAAFMTQLTIMTKKQGEIKINHKRFLSTTKGIWDNRSPESADDNELFRSRIFLRRVVIYGSDILDFKNASHKQTFLAATGPKLQYLSAALSIQHFTLLVLESFILH